METSPTPDANAKPEPRAEQEPNYVFPDASQAPVLHFDQSTGTAWIGFQFVRMDWEEIKLYLGHVQMKLYQVWRAVMTQRAEAEKMNAAIANGQRPANGIMGKLAHLGLLRRR